MKKVIGFVIVIGLATIIGCDTTVVSPPSPCDPDYYWCGDDVNGLCIPNEDDCCNSLADWCVYPYVCCYDGTCC